MYRNLIGTRWRLTIVASASSLQPHYSGYRLGRSQQRSPSQIMQQQIRQRLRADVGTNNDFMTVMAPSPYSLGKRWRLHQADDDIDDGQSPFNLDGNQYS